MGIPIFWGWRKRQTDYPFLINKKIAELQEIKDKMSIIGADLEKQIG